VTHTSTAVLSVITLLSLLEVLDLYDSPGQCSLGDFVNALPDVESRY
jgi:hypothetical protein